MIWPTWNQLISDLRDFKQKLSNNEIKGIEYIKTFQNEHPILDGVLQSAITCLPYPINDIAKGIYDKADNPVDGSIQVYEYLDRLGHQQQDHYEHVTNKLEQMDANMANEETQIEIKDILISTGDNLKRKLDDISKKINDIHKKIDGEGIYGEEQNKEYILRYLNTVLNTNDENLTESPNIENRIIEIKNIEWVEFSDPEDQKINWDIDNGLINNSKNRECMLVASYGMGKTRYTKFLEYTYAQKIKNELEHNSDSLTPIPILIKVEDHIKFKDVSDMKNFEVYAGFTIDNIITSIISKKEFKILIIIDRIDALYYENNFGLIDDVVKSYNFTYNLHDRCKKLMTTRPDIGVGQEIGSSMPCIGLKKLSPNESLEIINKDTSINQNVNFDNLFHSKTFVEILAKPFFCKILPEIISADDLPAYDILSEKNENARNAWIYFEYVNRILSKKSGKDQEKDHENRTLLRKIAALATLNRNKIVPSKTGIFSDAMSNNLEEIFGLAKVPNLNQLKAIVMTHESITEFLLAEYFLECIWTGKLHQLNVGFPTKLTIRFLGGIIQILFDSKNPILSDKIKREIFVGSCYRSQENTLEPEKSNLEQFNECLIHLFNQKELVFTKQIITNESHSIKDQHRQVKERENNTSKINAIWNVIPLTFEQPELYWIQRWIILFIINKSKLLTDENKKYHEHIKNSASQLIRQTSKQIPFYLKDFSNADFSDTDLSGSDLSRSVLKNTNLSGADLTGTILTNSTVKKGGEQGIVDFSDAHMFHTDLENAYLPNSNFSGSLMWQCDLGSSNLEKSDFDNTILQYVRINRSTNIKKTKMDNVGGWNSFLNDAIVDEKTKHVFKKRINNSEENLLDPKYDQWLIELKNQNFEDVRYSAIIDKNMGVQLFQDHKEHGNTPFLTNKDKWIMAHYSWLNWKQRNRIECSHGHPRISVIAFKKIIVLNAKIDDSKILLVTLNGQGDYQKIHKWIEEKQISGEQETYQHNSHDLNNEDSFLHPIKYFHNEGNLIKFRDKIKDLKLVLYVNVFNQKEMLFPHDDQKDKKFENQYKSTLKNACKDTIASSHWRREEFIRDLLRRWKYRKKFERKLGEPLYAHVTYEKRAIITTLLQSKKQEFLAFIVSEPCNDYRKIIRELLNQKQIFQNSDSNF